MNKLMIFCLIAAFILACGEGETDNANGQESDAVASNETTKAPVADAPDGEKIYKQYCVSCHGLYGDMGASGAFNLQESKLTHEERIQVVTNGRNTMVSFKPLLSEEQIEAVTKYTMELSDS